MGKLKYFPAFLSLRPILARLSLDEVGEVFLGALQYADEGTIPELDSTPAIVLEFIRQDIDRAQESYDELCAKNRENGAKNGKKSDGYRPLPTATDRYRWVPMGPKENVMQMRMRKKQKSLCMQGRHSQIGSILRAEGRLWRRCVPSSASPV